MFEGFFVLANPNLLPFYSFDLGIIAKLMFVDYQSSAGQHESNEEIAGGQYSGANNSSPSVRRWNRRFVILEREE